MQQPQSDNPNRRQAIQLAVQAHLQEYQALREQIVEWTRLGFLLTTTELVAVAVAFAYLTDESRGTEPAIFLILPLLFAFFGVYTVSFAASNVATAAYLTVVTQRTRQLIRLLDRQVPTDLIFTWEDSQRGLPAGQVMRRNNPLFWLVPQVIWLGASVLAWGLFFDQRPDPTPIHWFLFSVGILSNSILVVWALIRPRVAERKFLTVRQESLDRLAALETDDGPT